MHAGTDPAAQVKGAHGRVGERGRPGLHGVSQRSLQTLGNHHTDLVMIPNAFDRDGRTALVTGAGSPTGVGHAVATVLGSLGATVVVTSTTDRIAERVNQLRDNGITAHGAPADLTDPVAVDRLIAWATTQAGPIDIVVNNAGMTSVGSPMGTNGEAGALVDMSYEHWRQALTRNLDTTFLVTRAVLGTMIERQWGRIVNVASLSGPVMAMRDEPAYAAAKAAMVGLTRSVAVDHARHGITCNAVAPGWIATGSQTEHEAHQGDVTPAGRSATPDEVAAMVAMLCTPGASYTTGQCLVIDGGNSVAEERA